MFRDSSNYDRYRRRHLQNFLINIIFPVSEQKEWHQYITQISALLMLFLL